MIFDSAASLEISNSSTASLHISWFTASSSLSALPYRVPVHPYILPAEGKLLPHQELSIVRCYDLLEAAESVAGREVLKYSSPGLSGAPFPTTALALSQKDILDVIAQGMWIS